jgi:hypothetical protein
VRGAVALQWDYPPRAGADILLGRVAEQQLIALDPYRAEAKGFAVQHAQRLDGERGCTTP